MKAPDVRYLRPGSVTEALSALADDPDGTKVLAGGQSLLPVLNLRLSEPEILLDISKIDELRAVTGGSDGRRRYGSCIVHADFEDGRVPDAAGGLLCRTARGIGYRAIRNRGTLGGSLAHADPSAEWPVVMAALDARVLARSTRGEREIPCAALSEGYFTTALRADEIITEVLVTPLRPAARWGLCKFARKAGEFAESVAVAVVDGPGDAPAVARVWLGGAGSTPVRLAHVERAVVSGASPTEADVSALVGEDLSDWGVSSAADDYRRHLHGVTAWRAVTDALAGFGHADHAATAGIEEYR